jgi:hypothetical protein
VGVRHRISAWVALAALGCSSAHIQADAAPAADSGRDGGSMRDSGGADAGHRDVGPPVPRYRLEGAVVEGMLVGGTTPSTYQLLCGPTEVVVAHDGGTATDGYPDWYTLHCAELQTDGTLSGEHFTESIAADPAGCGPLAGTWVQRCPPGAVAVGMHGATVRFRTGAEIVGRLGLVCAPLDDWTRDGTGAEPLGVTTPNMDAALRDFDERCAPGHVLTQVSGFNGCLVESIRIGCRRVAR